MGLYLELYHGRKVLDVDMNGWGFHGPIIGPLEHISMTYMDILRVFCTSNDVAKECGFEDKEDVWLTHKEGCVEFQGNYYGDWSLQIMTDDKVKLLREEVTRVNAIPYNVDSTFIDKNKNPPETINVANIRRF